MKTTTCPAEQTIGEIQKLLSSHGVTAMMTEYDGRQVEAVSFRMRIEAREMAFRLPCNWRAVYEIFKTDPSARSNVKLKKGETFEDQAIKVAWRIILRWIEAQLALVEVNMVTVPQVFLPYTITKDGRTLAEVIESNPAFLLGEAH